MQARRAGAADFKYGWFMIDKSLTEIAAVRLLRLTGDAKGHLLCYFHFLQEWERFLVSKESGVGSPEEKNGVMVALAELADCGSEAVFKAQVGGWGQCCCCSQGVQGCEGKGGTGTGRGGVCRGASRGPLCPATSADRVPSALPAPPRPIPPCSCSSSTPPTGAGPRWWPR